MRRFPRLSPHAVGAIALLCAAAAHSQEAALPDAATGRALAERLCSTCHLVEGGATTSVPAGVPTLRGLANRPGQSARRIENALIQPHPPMPDMRLTASEIQHLLAYLETLRTNPQVPPLHTPPGERKPEWPKPS